MKKEIYKSFPKNSAEKVFDFKHPKDGHLFRFLIKINNNTKTFTST